MYMYICVCVSRIQVAHKSKLLRTYVANNATANIYGCGAAHLQEGDAFKLWCDDHHLKMCFAS